MAKHMASKGSRRPFSGKNSAQDIAQNTERDVLEQPEFEEISSADAPRTEVYEPDDDYEYEEYEEYEEGYDDKPRRKHAPVVPIVIVMLLIACGILVYIAYSLGAFGRGSADAQPTPEPILGNAAVATATPDVTATPEPTATPDPTAAPDETGSEDSTTDSTDDTGYSDNTDYTGYSDSTDGSVDDGYTISSDEEY